MYSQIVIDEKITAAYKKNGWRPTYHSTAWVDEFKHYIDTITKVDANSRNTYVDLTTKITKARSDEIRRFIQNEQILCTIDANYWETRYGYITDNAGESQKFSNRKSQEVFDGVLAQFDELQVAIELLVLKARQLGISTKVALKFLHRLLFIANTQALMSSVNAEKSELLSRMNQTCLEMQPWWLIPRVTTDRIKLTRFDNKSILSVQSGSQATGLAQGWTPTLVHISEIGDIPNPKKVLEEGLFKATHPTRKLFAVYEGTGNGNTGWQAETWRYSKANWAWGGGRSRLCPIFLSWPTATDQYPEADWLRKFPIPVGWTPHKETRKHVTRCEAYIRNTPYLAKIMGANWAMPRHQQWYWQFNYDEAAAKHSQRIWMQQMPADDIEALTGKNDPVFDEQIIVNLQEARIQDYQDYAVTGNSIDDGFEPHVEDIDYLKPRIRVLWQSHRGQRFEWIMVPLLPVRDEDEEKATLGRVRIFEHPEPGYEYTAGVDTADGLGTEDEDRCCLSMTHSVTGEAADRQVAEFVHNRVNAPQMVGFAACLAAYYACGADSTMIQTGDERGVKFCIEQRERPGDDCQLQLKLMGFQWHHINTTYDSKTLKETRGNTEGFRTNAVTRPMLTGRFVDAINNGWYLPQSKFLLAEMKDWERRTAANGKTRMDHMSGKHDDRIFGASLSYFSRHAFDVMAERAQKRYQPPSARKPEIDRSWIGSTTVSVGD